MHDNIDIAPVKYIHEDEIHNMVSPDIIVPYIISMFHPNSVADVGCGIGTFLNSFYKNGIADIRGFDGSWVNRSKLHIPEEYFTEADLERPLLMKREFDVVLCLEVAEHLQPASADIIVYSLTRLGKIIVFSAAIPNQEGQNHLNEQLPSYWQKKFAKHGYVYYDVFRPLFWENENVDWWYKQNMFLVAHESVILPSEIMNAKIEGAPSLKIHPDLYNLQIRRKRSIAERLTNTKETLKDIKEGKYEYRFYLATLFKKLFKTSKR